MTITKVSFHLLIQAYERTDIMPAVIPALRKLTVEVADDDVSGKSALLSSAWRVLTLRRMGGLR